MVRTRPLDVTDRPVVDVLRSGWGLVADDVRWLPVGFGSQHGRVHLRGPEGGSRFVTADDVLAKDPASLAAALGTAVRLRAAGLRWVVAPLPSRSASTWEPLGTRHVVHVYPDVAGRTFAWGEVPPDEHRDQVLDHVVQLHRLPPAASRWAEVDALAVEHRAQLELALASLDRPWGPGPFGEEARASLAARAEAVHERVRRHDARLARLRADGPQRWVLTHGEPHAGNTIATADGPVLVDWDTARLGIPERDLWHLLPGAPWVLDAYAERTGVDPDEDLLDLVGERWALSDVAFAVGRLQAPHGSDPDTMVARDVLRRMLAPSAR